jgi:predicted transposase/invertase (TIGR01784 family)
MTPDALRTHDSYFKFVFQDTERTRVFLETFLPERVLANLDLNHLTLVKDSFVNEELSEFFADLVFLCVTRKEDPVRVCLLLEHKSAPAPMLHVQLLQYLLGHWKQQIEVGDKTLDCVLPVVVYHGRAKWVTSPFIRDFGRIPADFACYIPEFSYQLVNLSQLKDAELETRLATLSAALKVLRYITQEQELIKRLVQIITLLSEDGNLLQSSLVYIFGRIKMGPDQMSKIMKELPGNTVKTFKSTADQLIEIGMEKGIEKGIEQGIEQGIEIGFEKGTESQMKSLLYQWYRIQKRSISDIAGILNWSEQEVEAKIELWGI